MNAPPQSTENSKGYPLGALFVLTAASAILVAMVTPIGKALTEKNLTGFELLIACLLGGAAGMFFGVVIGLHQLRKVRGLFCGLGAGAVLGALAGAICMIPAEGSSATFYASLGGSAILIGVGAVLRFTSTKA